MLKGILIVLGGIWGVITTVGKGVWTLLSTKWDVALLVALFCFYLYPYFSDWIARIFSHLGDIFLAIGNANATVLLVIHLGWPPVMADGFAYLNAFFPVPETMLYFEIILLSFLACTLIRMVKHLVLLGKDML